MNLLSRTITGGTLILAGMVLAVVSFFTSLFILIWAVLVLVIGLVIFFNKNEDRIEEIKVNKLNNRR